MSNFVVKSVLPALGCVEQDHYDMVETLAPTTDVVDDETIEIVGEKFYAKLSVPRWEKFTVSHADFQTAGLTNDIQILLLPGAGVIERVVMKHSEAFAGTGITAYTISCGIVGNLTKYAGAFNVFQAIGDTVFQLASNPGAETFNAAGVSIRVEATSTDANLDQSTAGSLDIWVLYGACL